MNDSKNPFINITVIGVGGAGNNTLENIPKEKFAGVNFLFANTDKQVLDKFNKNQCIFLNVGDSFNDGLGSGADPQIGKLATQNSNKEIEQALKNTRLLIITAGLGGGTGTGGSPVIANIAKKMGILTIAIVTTPFSFEGPKRKSNADLGLKELQKNVDAFVVVSNDKLLNNYPDVPLEDAFQLTNNVLKNCIKSFTDLILKSSTINLDFADLSSIIKGKGEIYIGFGKGVGNTKVAKAIDSALNSKIIEKSIKGANNAIINIVADPTISINQTNQIIEQFKEKSVGELDVIFGLNIDQNLRNEIQISIIATFNSNKNDELNNNDEIDDKKTQETLLKIGNTLELEISSGQTNNFVQEEEKNINHQIDNEEEVFIKFDDNEDDDIPFFLK